MNVDDVLKQFYYKKNRRYLVNSIITLSVDFYLCICLFLHIEGFASLSGMDYFAFGYLILNLLFNLFQIHHFVTKKRFYVSSKKWISIIFFIIHFNYFELIFPAQFLSNSIHAKMVRRIQKAYQYSFSQGVTVTIDSTAFGESEWLPTRLVKKINKKHHFPFFLTSLTGVLILIEVAILSFAFIFTPERASVFSSFIILNEILFFLSVLTQYREFLRQIKDKKNNNAVLIDYIFDGRLFNARYTPFVLGDYCVFMSVFVNGAEFCIDPADERHLIIRLHHVNWDDGTL